MTMHTAGQASRVVDRPQAENLSLTGSEHLADSVEVSQFALGAADEVRRAETLVPLVLDLHCLSIGCGQEIESVISGEMVGKRDSL